MICAVQATQFRVLEAAEFTFCMQMPCTVVIHLHTHAMGEHMILWLLVLELNSNLGLGSRVQLLVAVVQGAPTGTVRCALLVSGSIT